LLWRCLLALEGSVTRSSTAIGTANCLTGSGEGAIEGKAKKDLVIGKVNVIIRKNN
jgi:hypothetical protein